MTIFVDELFVAKGRQWAHLMTDEPGEAGLKELHAFAAKLGLKRSWFQGHDPRIPHYDLYPSKRSAAIAYGAQPVKSTEMVRRCVWERNGETHRPPTPTAPAQPPAVELVQESFI